MKSRIRSVIAVVAAVAVFSVAGAALAKELPPKPEKMKKLSFPEFKEWVADNGMEVVVVEHHEQPIVSLSIVVRAGDALDPSGKESVAAWTINQITKGTSSRTALELAEWIESVGGSVNAFSQKDFSGVSVTVLSDYLDVAFEYLRDVVRDPVFPEDELELVRKQTKTGLELELSNPNAMAQRHIRKLIYGDHPYGKQAGVESVEAITREDLVAFHEKNFVPNNILFAVVGDVKSKNVKKAVKRHFGDWQQGTPAEVTYEGAPSAPKTKIYLYHRPGAVQTEVWVGHLAPKATDSDWPAMVVGNRILGGGADARLFMDLREDKGWTYGAYSSFTRERDMGTFMAHSAVRTEVTDSALVELLQVVDRITKEPVSDEDIMNAKSYLIGNFPVSIETPSRIARIVGRYKLLGLGKADLEQYRERIANVEIADVSRVMKEHVRRDNMYIVLVGDVQEIKDKVEAVADIELFDIAGEPMSSQSLAVEGVDYDYDTSMLADMKSAYSLNVQGMDLGEMNVTMTKRSGGDSETIEVTSSLAGMVKLDETMEFRLDDLAPLAYTSKMEVPGGSMHAEFAFTETNCSGTVKGMQAPEPKEVAFELVPGTIIGGAVEFAMGCLDLSVGKSYRFPVVDGQTGSLQNVVADVLELTDVETGAGTFKAFKVKIKRAEGESFMYFDSEGRHIMVKMEAPSQAMTMLLKSIN